jgi:ABC-type transport system involved in multi-copper enzyme maturation permease subunit
MSPPAADARPISFASLVLVEARKAVDTRGSRILLMVTSALALLLMVVGIVLDGSETLGQAVGGVAASFALFLPLIGLLLVTQEWTQRTAYLTFTAVPQRPRVLLAKAAAALGLVAAVILLAVLAAVIVATVRGWTTGAPLPSADLAPAVRSVLAAGLCSTLLGVAIGAITLSTTVSVLVFIFIPFGIDLALARAPQWLAEGLSASTLSSWVGGDQTFSAATLMSLLVWYLLPGVAGTLRFTRSDVT